MITREIPSYVAREFLLPRHYSGRTPSISKAFGWYDGDRLMAVVTYGKPATHSLCIDICGEECSDQVYELNRLCRVPDLTLQLSEFVSETLRRLKTLDWIIVSYSDSRMNHHGYIYQACNFLYTGETKERTDMYTPDGKHSRHYKKGEETGIRKVRSAKFRYIYFCSNHKKTRKQMQKALRYEILPYPKGENSNYVLGDFMGDVFVKDDGTLATDMTSEKKPYQQLSFL